MLGLVLLLVPIICLHHAFYKIHPWKLFVFGKIFAHGKIKSGRKSQGKKTESRPKEERKSTILSRKEKYSFVKVIGTGGAPCWRQDFDWRSPRRTKICQTLLKTRFPFLHASTSLDKKTWTIASNRNFESCICRFVVLLLSTFSGFSIFAAGSSFAFGNFTHYCVVLLNAPRSDLGGKKRHVSAMGYFSWEISIHRWPQGVPLPYWFAGFRRRDNLLAWHELFANLYELTSRILVLGGIQPLWANMKGIWIWPIFVKFRQNIRGIMTNESVSENFDIWNT